LSAEHEPTRSKFRLTILDAQLVVTVFAVVIASLALFYALRNERRIRLVDNEVTTEQAEFILERANDATTFADSILSFLEGASVVIGAGLAVGAWILRNSIQKQFEESRAFAERAEARIREREHQLDNLEKMLVGQLDSMVQTTTGQIADVRRQGRDSFRLLSLLVLAEQQVRAHNIETAIRTLQDAYKLDADNHAANYLLGYLYTTRKEFDKAIERLHHALEQDPNFTPALAALGLAMRRKGDSLHSQGQFAARDQLWAQAETKLLEALSQDPRLTDADGESYYGTLGGLYRRQGRYDQAIQAYEKAHAITPNSSYPIANLATLHIHQGHAEQSTRFFHRVLKTAELQLDDDPRDVWTRADYAQAKLVLGYPDEALEQIKMILDQKPERTVLDTVRNGLQFLADSRQPIQGLEAMIELLNQAIAKLDAESVQQQT